MSVSRRKFLEGVLPSVTLAVLGVKVAPAVLGEKLASLGPAVPGCVSAYAPIPALRTTLVDPRIISVMFSNQELVDAPKR